MTVVHEAPGSVLAVFAHPDDPEAACGGTLARWAASGAAVHVVLCTSGDKGTSDATVDPAALAARRAGEVRAAAEALGLAGVELLGHPDGELDADVLRSEIVAAIRRVRPEVVICPDPTAAFFGEHYVNHPDHRTVGWAAVDAAAHMAGRPHYVPDAGPAHQPVVAYLSGTLEPDAWVDISDFIAAKTAALRCHVSQLGEPGEWLREVVRERAQEAGRTVGVAYAEGFRRLLLA